MRHRFDSLMPAAELRRIARKLHDDPTPETLRWAACAYAAGLGRYVSPQIVELAELAYVAEWLADRDDPAAHAPIAAAAVRLILQEER